VLKVRDPEGVDVPEEQAAIAAKPTQEQALGEPAAVPASDTPDEGFSPATMPESKD
jgi:hypothetical protein